MNDDFIEAVENRDLIDRAMAGLNTVEREVVLSLIRGEKPVEIAAKMGCKRQNVNYYRKCAIEKMRCCLK